MQCCGKGGRRANNGGITISSDSRYNNSEYLYEDDTAEEDDTAMMDSMKGIIAKQEVIPNDSLSQELKELKAKQGHQRHAKRRS